MTFIIGGGVRYLRRVKTGDYEHAEFAAELHLGPKETGGALSQEEIEAAAEYAKDLTLRTLGIAKPAAAKPGARGKNVPAAPAATATLAVDGAGAQSSEAPDPLDLGVGGGAPTTAASAATTAAATTAGAAQAAADPLDVGVSPASAPTSASAPTAAASATADPLAVTDEWAAQPAAVTDEAILAACSAKNGVLKKPPLIRELVARYVPGGQGTARQIPAEKRAAFLLELEKLS